MRYDAAGSTLVFKDYLSKYNPVFKAYTTDTLGTAWPPTLSLGCRGIGRLSIGGGCGFRQGLAFGGHDRSPV